MDALIDPVTRAYVYDNGGLKRDPANGLANAVYLRWMTPLGTWWGNPNLGSLLHKIAAGKAAPHKLVLAKQYGEQALADLITSGRASSITVDAAYQAMDDGSKAMAMVAAVVDATGLERVFTHHIPVA